MGPPPAPAPTSHLYPLRPPFGFFVSLVGPFIQSKNQRPPFRKGVGLWLCIHARDTPLPDLLNLSCRLGRALSTRSGARHAEVKPTRAVGHLICWESKTEKAEGSLSGACFGDTTRRRL